MEQWANLGYDGDLGQRWYRTMPKETMHNLLSEWQPKPRGNRAELATEKGVVGLSLECVSIYLHGLHIFPQGARGLESGNVVIERGGPTSPKRDVTDQKKGLSASTAFKDLVGLLTNQR